MELQIDKEILSPAQSQEKVVAYIPLKNESTCVVLVYYIKMWNGCIKTTHDRKK